MRKTEAIFALAGLAVALTIWLEFRPQTAQHAVTPPIWAYPVPSHPAPAAKLDNTRLITIPDSNIQFTEAGANRPATTTDWHPNDHPPMPQVVAYAAKSQTYACGYCHLANGQGRPENAPLAGQPAAYIVEQVMEMKAGRRMTSQPAMASIKNMVQVARTISPKDLKSAAAYFSSLKYRKWIRVIETAESPKFDVSSHNFLVPANGGGTEPIGSRIVELPENPERTDLRDARSGFIAYVPDGAIARGKNLVESGDGGHACKSCHGADLKGSGNVPGLAGRSPSMIVRQLFDIQQGSRTGQAVDPMRPQVAHMSDEDRVDVAAYLASLKP